MNVVSISRPALRDLSGRHVLITGASAGCGLAIAEAFAGAGAIVTLLARTAASVEAAAAGIRRTGGNATGLACDVTDNDALRAAIAALPCLDVLVNNAGTNIPEPLVDVSAANLDALIDINLRAAFVATSAAVEKMRQHPNRASRGGLIVNITSQMGHVGAPDRTVYCMTKHGLEGLTKALAVELAAENIRVNSVAPTFVATPLIMRIVDTHEKRAAMVARIPMNRMADESEIAEAVLYLASDAATMVTGISLKVDGGWTAQ